MLHKHLKLLAYKFQVRSRTVIFHQELNNEDGNLEDKYCSQIKASCHINGHVIVTAMRSESRITMRKSQEMHDAPRSDTWCWCMYECVAGPFFFLACITFTLHKDLTFSESQVTWSVDWKCRTNNVSTRIPCTSGLCCELQEKINASVVTCFMILVIKLVHCMSAALQTVPTLSYCGCQTTLRDILDTTKVLLFCVILHDLFHLEWPYTAYLQHSKSIHNHCTILTLNCNVCYSLQLDLLFEVSALCPVLNVFRSFLPKFLNFFSSLLSQNCSLIKHGHECCCNYT